MTHNQKRFVAGMIGLAMILGLTPSIDLSSIAISAPASFIDAATIHTQTTKLNVSSSGRIGHRQNGARFSFYADGSDYLLDGSLILGTDADDLSWLIYEGGSSLPTPDNPFGYLLPMSDLTVDSVSSSLHTIAHGLGTNRDSTVGFSVTYYAPKGSFSGVYIMRFAVFKGINDATGTVSNLTIAYAIDWNIPSDIGFNNACYYEAQRQLIWQQGAYTPPNNKRYGGIGVLRDDALGIPGGFVWKNASSVDPWGTFENDSLWDRMEAINGYQLETDTANVNTVTVVARDLTINGATNDTFYFDIVVAGARLGGGPEIEGSVTGAYYYICDHIAPNCIACSCQLCGDANGDDAIDISDAIYTLQYIFANGPEPNPYCRGDVNGDVLIDISDPIFLIQYIFAGGGVPLCDWWYPW